MKPTPAQIRSLSRRDPTLGKAIRRLGPFPGFPENFHRRTPTFAYLARAIIFQQLAYAAANTIWLRATSLKGESGKTSASEIASLSDAKLRGAGLSRAKLAALRDLSQKVMSGELKLGGLSRLEDEEVIHRLVAVRGIGPWTAKMFLIFKLGRLDVLPSTDLGVQEGLRQLDGLRERPNPKELELRAECWKPLQSVASWYLWRRLDSPEGDW